MNHNVAQPPYVGSLSVKAHMSKGGLACSERSTALKNISIIANILPNAAQEHTGSLQNVKPRSGGYSTYGGDAKSAYAEQSGRNARSEKLPGTSPEKP